MRFHCAVLRFPLWPLLFLLGIRAAPREKLVREEAQKSVGVKFPHGRVCARRNVRT